MNSKIVCILLFLLSQFVFAQEDIVNESSSIKPVQPNSDWKFNSTVTLPFRGFEIQTRAKDSQTQDPLGSISYSPSPNLEGQVYLSYKNFGFTYSRTLAAASLDSTRNMPASINDGYKFSFLLSDNLFELTQQNLSGMKTNVSVDGDAEKTIARSDIELSDTRFRWVYGMPLWGADQANSLANFYSHASILKGDTSLDLLTSIELVKQEIAGSTPFIPAERQATFGTGSTLSKISSYGMGAGAGVGFTALMRGESYFSIGGLLGGNYSFSKAEYSSQIESSNGLGFYANAWMSVQFVFGSTNRQNLGFKLAHNDWSIPAQDNKVNSHDSSMSLNYGLFF